MSSKFCVKPSRIISTIFGTKGDEFDTVIALAVDTVPSVHALAVQSTHEEMFHAEIHLIHVLNTRSRRDFFILETMKEKEDRLASIDNVEGEAAGASQTLSEALQGSQNSDICDTEDDAKDALGVLGLETMPTTLQSLTAYLTVKRHLTNVDGLPAVDNATTVIRRRLLSINPGFSSPPRSLPLSLTYGASTSEVTGDERGSEETGDEEVNGEGGGGENATARNV